MPQRISLSKIENSIGGAAAIIAVFSIFTKLLGLWRDRLLSSSFGAGEILDAYLASFRLPDLVFNVLILGAFSSSFIPVFLSYFQKDKEEGWRLANATLNLLFLIIFILTILIIVFAKNLVPLIVPGLSSEAQEVTVKLTRIISLSILFFIFSNVFSAILNSFHKFFLYSLAPLLYNLGIIFGILFLTKTELGVSGLAWGVVFGSFLHFLIQVPGVLKLGFRPQFLFSFLPGVKKIFLLMVPRFLGLAVNQVNILLTTIIASFLVSGAITIYNLAFNLNSVPVGLVGIPLSLSLFPILSQAAADGENNFFKKKFLETLKQIFYFILPLTVVFFFFRQEIAAIILKAGLFTEKDSFLTGQTLGYFSLSLLAQNLIPLFSRAFYAKQDTKTPVLAACFGMFFNFLGCLYFGKLMGPPGLGLAFTLSSFLNLFLLFSFFKKKGFKFEKEEFFSPLLKFLFLSLLIIPLIVFLKVLFAFLPVFLETLIIVLIVLLFYYFLSLLFKIEEAKKVKDIFKLFYA